VEPKSSVHGTDNRPGDETKRYSFLIAEAEVSSETWGNVMGTYSPLGGIATEAMTRISYQACEQFCEKTGLFIPSESQWLFACFGRDQRRVAPEPASTRPAVSSRTAYRLLLPCHTFEGAPNGHKLYYMRSDEVGEWCKPDGETFRDPAAAVGRRVRITKGDDDEAVILGLWRPQDADSLQGLTALIASRDASYISVGLRPCFPLR
jgi:hypothetical protein